MTVAALLPPSAGRCRRRRVATAYDPTFHYQPTLFAEVPDENPEALLQPGPNSPVGVVWMALSKKHYGLHGTSDSESIGYASSHGCIRLTNWSPNDWQRAGRPKRRWRSSMLDEAHPTPARDILRCAAFTHNGLFVRGVTCTYALAGCLAACSAG